MPNHLNLSPVHTTLGKKCAVSKICGPDLGYFLTESDVFILRKL